MDDKKRKINIRLLLAIVLLLGGLSMILVPVIKTYFNTKQNDDIIEEFLKQAEMAAGDIESFDDVEVEEPYELFIPTQKPEEATDPLDTEEPPLQSDAPESSATTETSTPPQPTPKPKMSKEERARRTTGVLLIPKIDVKMLIMDGTDDETLRVAAGRLTYTDNFDEIGNCVIAAHRSYTFGKYLNRLNELVEGDKITVQTKTKTLNYTVYKSLIVEPDDFSIINKNDKDKILTVFTCHPPGVGSHRLVVHALQDDK